MESTLIFLLLGFTCVISVSESVTTAHTGVLDEIWKESLNILNIEQRHRRDATDNTKSEFEWFLKNKETFCFCGKKNWITKFAQVNRTENQKCIHQSKVVVTASDKDKLISRFSSIAKASQCAYDCIFKSLNLFTSDGPLNKTAAREMFKDKVLEEEGLQETANKVLDKCLSTGTGNPVVSNFMLSYASSKNCKNDAYKFIICLLTELVEECPEMLRRNDELRCTQMYENMKLTRKAAVKVKIE